jgi:hypothetical protein
MEYLVELTLQEISQPLNLIPPTHNLPSSPIAIKYLKVTLNHNQNQRTQTLVFLFLAWKTIKTKSTLVSRRSLEFPRKMHNLPKHPKHFFS